MTKNTVCLLKKTLLIIQLLKNSYAAIALIILFLFAIIVADLNGYTPSRAVADENLDALNMTAYELQQEIEVRQATYKTAREAADVAAAQTDIIRARLENLSARIPEQQRQSAKAVRKQYKFQRRGAGIVDMMLCTEDFYSFLMQIEYMTYISDANTHEMAQLTRLKKEIEKEQEELKAAQREAEEKAEEALEAMEATEAAQAEVQRRISEEIRLQAEIAAQAEQLAETPRNNDLPANEESNSSHSETTSSTAANSDSGNSNTEADTSDINATSTDTQTKNADEVSPADDSIDGWAARIDAYLAGSPLAGQGHTFAAAAFQYNVDPRWSPAIAFTESSKGLFCFRSHNAWGWGSSSWDSWEAAIDAHVGGLSRGYGYTISTEAAKKYCPPNWRTWYDRTLTQMEMI